MSIVAPRATPPVARIFWAVEFAASELMSAQITFAPSSARRIALASPIPEPAPVTIATLFSTLICNSSLLIFKLLV